MRALAVVIALVAGLLGLCVGSAGPVRADEAWVLRSASGSQDYVSEEQGYTGASQYELRARSSSQGPSEGWTLVQLGDGVYALRSNSTGMYVSEEQGYTGADQYELRARASAISAREQFGLRWNTDGTYSLQSLANGNYVSVEYGYTGGDYAELRARASSVGPWEEFLPQNPPTPAGVTATAVGAGTIHVAWTDTSGGTDKFVVSNGNVASATLPVGTTSFDWGGLAAGTSMCFTVTDRHGSTKSPRSAYGCATTWSHDTARADLLQRIAGQPSLLLTRLHDNRGGSMDTAKVIQLGPHSYLAAYTVDFVVKLASSSDLVHWAYLADLDPNASQPYFAAAPDGRSFVLADEKQDTPGNLKSHLYFLHYPDLAALDAAAPDKTFTPSARPPGHGSRFFSPCNEGTPDIHTMSSDGTTFSVGFHYLSNCLNGRDQEASGTLTGFSAMTATRDTVRDTAVDNAGYPGKHGGRDDIVWHGFRYSIQEAQNSRSDYSLYTTWRFVLYDYSNHQAYAAPITSHVSSPCHGNPKLTQLTDANGHPVLLITDFIFRECAAAGESGVLLYTVPAQ